MMAASSSTRRLIDRLPAVDGRYAENAPLAGMSWFRVGGPAEVLFRPADGDDLARFLAARPGDVPVHVIGAASNLLIRDGGVPGVVVRLGRGFAGIEVEGTTLRVGCGALDTRVAAAAGEASIAGLEFLSGIPGTIGGALRMNAGAFGAEIKDVVAAVRALDASGAVHQLGPADLGFAYRRCAVPEDWIFVTAELAGQPGERAAIARRMAEIATQRRTTQPRRVATGGSTFANPPGARAWELIERAGCRGLVRGGARVSNTHCNFLVNTGEATASDLEELGEEVRRRVFAATGVRLEWEIRRLGVAAGTPLGKVEP